MISQLFAFVSVFLFGFRDAKYDVRKEAREDTKKHFDFMIKNLLSSSILIMRKFISMNDRMTHYCTYVFW